MQFPLPVEVPTFPIEAYHYGLTIDGKLCATMNYHRKLTAVERRRLAAYYSQQHTGEVAIVTKFSVEKGELKFS